MEKTNLYQVITDKFVNALKGGRIPWQKPWTGSCSAARNFGSKTGYSLLNQMLIELQAEERYRPVMSKEEADGMVEKVATGRFLTFNAVQGLKDARVNQGAKSYIVTFFKFYQPKDKDGNPATTTNSKGEEIPKLIPMLRYYRVFSEYDCTGIPAEKLEVRSWNPIEEAEKIMREYEERNSPLKIKVRKSDRAYYSPSGDYIVLPELKQYRHIEEFYSTAFHEITHSTGHSSRLGRIATGLLSFGNDEYSREELVAEIGSAMCLNRLGIDTQKSFRNSVAYVQSWLKALQNDNKMIFWASSRAEAAVKFIFNDKDGSEAPALV